MFENKQKVYVLIMLLMVMLLSISQNTKGNANIPLAPVSEEGFLPNPFQCVNDARKVPNCIDAVKKFQFKIITKECCFVLLKAPEDCLGMLFPMRFVIKIMLQLTCRFIGIHA
ncbi:unnamed protein product [Brassica rapa]|uniref:Prolamin-like domain-containing protein n=1 Tax=Brassica campestris TaxID=3711 RepID=A0A3P5YC18_BRACM|nr:unnamed protein product [Brassica rapa]VDC65046.1 unnamed protein product [Brassica rapa]